MSPDKLNLEEIQGDDEKVKAFLLDTAKKEFGKDTLTSIAAYGMLIKFYGKQDADNLLAEIGIVFTLKNEDIES